MDQYFENHEFKSEHSDGFGLSIKEIDDGLCRIQSYAWDEKEGKIEYEQNSIEICTSAIPDLVKILQLVYEMSERNIERLKK